MKMHEILRAGHIHRWNIVSTYRSQSIAEHMWNVTMIATELSLRLNIEEPAPAGFIGLCLKHDRHEVTTGDVPTPTKRKFDSKEYPNTWYSTAEYGVDPEYDLLKENYTSTVYELVLSIADILEGEWFLRVWGNEKSAHVTEIRRELYERRLKAIAGGQMFWPEYSWKDIVHTIYEDMYDDREKFTGRHKE